MSILDALAQDHRQIEKVISSLGDISSAKPAERIAVFSKLQTLLVAHSRAEEEVVYRRLHQRGADEQKTLEAYEEHHVADILLQELASGCPGGAAWAAKVQVLEELLRHHIKEEELNIFPLVTDAFDEATRALMDEEFTIARHDRLEALFGRLRRATPAFLGRAAISLQVAAGRGLRRGELSVHRALAQLRARRSKSKLAATVRAMRKSAPVRAKAKIPKGAVHPMQRPPSGGTSPHVTH